MAFGLPKTQPVKLVERSALASLNKKTNSNGGSLVVPKLKQKPTAAVVEALQQPQVQLQDQQTSQQKENVSDKNHSKRLRDSDDGNEKEVACLGKKTKNSSAAAHQDPVNKIHAKEERNKRTRQPPPPPAGSEAVTGASRRNKTKAAGKASEVEACDLVPEQGSLGQHQLCMAGPIDRHDQAPSASLNVAGSEDARHELYRNGDEIFRAMQQLAEDVGGLIDDDEKKGRRRKETPLRDKLHKSWGGRVSR